MTKDWVKFYLDEGLDDSSALVSRATDVRIQELKQLRADPILFADFSGLVRVLPSYVLIFFVFDKLGLTLDQRVGKRGFKRQA
jgi:hypothetical protein